jgi:hypothetical protein
MFRACANGLSAAHLKSNSYLPILCGWVLEKLLSPRPERCYVRLNQTRTPGRWLQLVDLVSVRIASLPKNIG